MTLAALSPLYTWWLLFFALLVVVRLGAGRTARRHEPPAELVAAINAWPPPSLYLAEIHRLVDEPQVETWPAPRLWERVTG